MGYFLPLVSCLRISLWQTNLHFSMGQSAFVIADGYSPIRYTCLYSAFDEFSLCVASSVKVEIVCFVRSRAHIIVCFVKILLCNTESCSFLVILRIIGIEVLFSV